MSNTRCPRTAERLGAALAQLTMALRAAEDENAPSSVQGKARAIGEDLLKVIAFLPKVAPADTEQTK